MGNVIASIASTSHTTTMAGNDARAPSEWRVDQALTTAARVPDALLERYIERVLIPLVAQLPMPRKPQSPLPTEHFSVYRRVTPFYVRPTPSVNRARDYSSRTRTRGSFCHL